MLLGLLIAIISVISIISIIVYCLSKHKRIKRFKRLLMLSILILISSITTIRVKSLSISTVTNYSTGCSVYEYYDLFNFITGKNNSTINEWDKKVYTLTDTVVVPNTQTVEVSGKDVKVIDRELLNNRIFYKFKKPIYIQIENNIYVVLNYVDIDKENSYIISYAEDGVYSTLIDGVRYNVYARASLKYGSTTMVCL